MADADLFAPLSSLQWVDREQLKPNDYNPNKVNRENLKLLVQSIMTNGWTLPIVVRPDYTIIDGFHRWTVAGEEPLHTARRIHRTRAAYLRLAVLLPPPLGIVALRAGKCVATGDDGKRYCDDPRPTRRGLADPEKSVVTKAKIRHFVTHQPMLLVPIEAPVAVSAVISPALSALLRENVEGVSIKASYEDKTTARDNGLAASGRCSSAILVSPAPSPKKGVCYMAGQSEKITDETEVSTTELATVLGVSARRVQQMAQDGTVPTCRKGFFRLADSVQRYIKFLSDGPMDEEDKKLEKARRVAETTMKASKATIAKLEAEELKGTMHRAEDVAALTEDLVYTIRGALNALPGRLAVDVAAVSTPAEASEVIRKEVSKVMRELAGYHYDPKKYEERVRERRDWSERDSDDE